MCGRPRSRGEAPPRQPGCPSPGLGAPEALKGRRDVAGREKNAEFLVPSGSLSSAACATFPRLPGAKNRAGAPGRTCQTGCLRPRAGPLSPPPCGAARRGLAWPGVLWRRRHRGRAAPWLSSASGG